MKFAQIFLEKTTKYLKQYEFVIPGDVLRTKLICVSSQDLDRRNHILLGKSSLKESTLEELVG